VDGRDKPGHDEEEEAREQREDGMSGSEHDPVAVRARLQHPIIDGDGHWIEYGPVFAERMRRVGGEAAWRGFAGMGAGVRESLALTVAERRRRGLSQEAFWARPEKNTIDRATAMLPRLLHQRLPELGIDFAIIYPTAGLRIPRIADDEARRAAARAFNVVTAEYFRDLGDRMAPVAVIPMHDPEEAIAELEFATQQLGFKAAMFGSLMERPLDGGGQWHDVVGLDSPHDYDPVWQRCLDLRIAPTFHSGARRQGLRLSPSNFTYNHIGHFAAAGHAVCKAMVLGGVTRRFPGLRLAFLEGGVGWATMLYADLLSHWEKRSRKGLEVNDPRNLDRRLLMELAEKHGYGEILAALKERDGWPAPGDEKLTGNIADLDDFSRCEVTSKADFRALFLEPLFFGCEADDPMNAWAFDRRVNPGGARLNAIFSSDIGHFDVPDMREVVPEAYELVEHDLISASDFRDFTFANAVRLWGTQNPAFFHGTTVAAAAAAVLAEGKAETAAA
jgi:predicted TIM-barrel fold metal-dependent hydrolase